ncbi:hypothetical protein [Streptomyces sp. NPDC001815]|uniref:hypothetical protein n=1 Tax=Streptomyces sp. NPDC001815 TaxID=3154526 RepID=UPI003320E219
MHAIATTWIMLPRGALKPRKEEQLLKVRLACPDTTRACDLTHAFHDLLQQRRGPPVTGVGTPG